MIPGSNPVVQTVAWQALLADAVRDPIELLKTLDIDPAHFPQLEGPQGQFPLRVPAPYLARIQRGNPADPLLLQVMPTAAESLQAPGYVSDPLQESRHSPAPGLIHKYHGRVLLVVTSACAVHCRYCFRRHFPYQEHQLSTREWQTSLDYIAERPDISEVILSGGDPLALNDKRLAALIEQLQGISHLKRLRLHTRLPVVLPQRVTPELVEMLGSCRLATTVVVHSNHPQELDNEVGRAFAALRQAQVTLLNQAVLLKGINDSASCQAELSEALFFYGALPYYLHLLDPVAGASHFDINELQAIEIHKEMLAKLPGYLVPRLVREIPGEPNKSPVTG